LQCVSTCASLRQSVATNSYFVQDNTMSESDPIRDIEEKWDKMDDFVGIMFTLACKWKHGKDLNALASHKLRSGDLVQGEVTDFKAKIQGQNAQHLKEACGRLVASSKGKCRQSCSSRWGVALARRADCDKKCITLWENFENQCNKQVDHLKMVYEMKLNAAAARKQCHEGHCAKFPTTWMLDTEEDMKNEADAQCEKQCTEEQIRLGCERRWLLEVDFLRPSIRSTCFMDGQAKACFDGKKASMSGEHEQCTTTGKSTCESQYAQCQQEGKTDSTFKDAQEFCDSRKKMCESQVTKHCQNEHKTSLESAKEECEKADEQALQACVTEKLSEKETEETTKCIGDMTPKCSEVCHQKCNVAAMSQCLNNLKSEHDEAEDFCEDFWRLLHESSELDPATHDPVTQLAP